MLNVCATKGHLLWMRDFVHYSNFRSKLNVSRIEDLSWERNKFLGEKGPMLLLLWLINELGSLIRGFRN